MNIILMKRIYLLKKPDFFLLIYLWMNIFSYFVNVLYLISILNSTELQLQGIVSRVDWSKYTYLHM